MMPVYPGTPWMPKFKGPGDKTIGLLGSQELTEAKRVDIDKRQVSVLEEGEKDQVRKIFLYLDSLYGDRTPASVVRSQFYSCIHRPGETVPSFVLRLQELYSRLRQHDPDNSPSDAAQRDQLRLGLQEVLLAQALKVYARRNPAEDFAAIRQETLLLDAVCSHTLHTYTFRTLTRCSFVDNLCVLP